MAWLRKHKQDDVPWYRHQNYKGGLREDQKMELDSIRWQAKSEGHPAAGYDDLPEEVQSYIAELEIEISDERSFLPILSMAVTTVVVIYSALIALNIVQYYELATSIYDLFYISIAIFIFSFIRYRNVRKIELSRDANKAFLKNWEINYISNRSTFISEND